MFNWAKQQLANVAGTQEPIYGPSAIKSVATEAEKTPYTEISRNDLKWQAMDSTSVETHTFYIFGDNGYIALAQLIYSNVAGIRTTCQFNAKVFSSDPSKPHLWASTPLNNHDFNEDKTTGTTGTTLYGTDLENPWGSMRHAFWPRCVSEGTITTKDGPMDFKGKAFFAYALQGMKPHHAASRWNFLNFQGPTYSAVLMEFTSTPSYGSTLVNVGGIVKDGEIVIGGVDNTATHTQVKKDSENDWPEPSDAKYTWAGKTKDGKAVEASVEGSLGERVDRVDVMAEVPGFVKTIVAAAAGTKPYIYQYHPKLSLKMKIGDEEIVEEGTIFTEATFIS
ncbi:survival factor 1 [Fusarium oxysporum f. sp. lycopersici 4287]|uniref:Survival factor 1 n=1 Tax=Fusarium oxysporum f. sp. lycopersici (strain 4287 / CBS 123668 / FGSC 9935 / NRRL 34936) TaxID=426428 RepID=A0A0J9V7E4_FUSO4|nr:survival factor 1 [Fusarium oxysporum f. sp. lycopersici 4287]KNB07459.1 survival factor 1 [Fusarium oxysporum f. sp. lycopersici 4287]